MSHISKFPYGGYELVIYNREDILKSIDDNIVDKEVLTDIINHLEFDIYNTLSSGRWTGYPYLGSFKFKEFKAATKREDIQELLHAAKVVLDKSDYIAFKKKTYKDINYEINYNKLYKHTVIFNIKKNNAYYTARYKTKGEHFAKLAVFMAANAKPSICDCIELGYANR